MSPRGRPRPLPGGWFAVAGRMDWITAALAQLALVSLLPWPTMLLGRIGSAGARHTAEQAWARVAAGVLRMRIEVRGFEVIDPRTPYLVLPLHEGLADPLVLFRFGLPLRFVARAELRSWPVVGAYLRMTGQLMVAEGAPRPARALLRAARHAVRRGESIVVFPQGSVLGLEVGFRPGVLRLAQVLGLPVLPVVISGTHRVWEHPFTPRLRFGQAVSATVLPPVEVRGLDRGELSALLLSIERAMKSTALSPGHAPPRRYEPRRDGTWDRYDFVIDPAFIEVAAALPHRVRRQRSAEVR